jgi:hypothetical protein
MPAHESIHVYLWPFWRKAHSARQFVPPARILCFCKGVGSGPRVGIGTNVLGPDSRIWDRPRRNPGWNVQPWGQSLAPPDIGTNSATTAARLKKLINISARNDTDTKQYQDIVLVGGWVCQHMCLRLLYSSVVSSSLVYWCGHGIV